MNKNTLLYGIIVVLLVVIAFMAGRLSSPTPVSAATTTGWEFTDGPGGLVCASFNGVAVGCYCPCDIDCQNSTDLVPVTSTTKETPTPPTDTPTPTPPTETPTPPTPTPPTGTPTPTPPTNTPTPPTPTPPPTDTPTPTPNCVGNPGNAKCVGKSGETPNGNPQQFNPPPVGPGTNGASDGIKKSKPISFYYRQITLILRI